METNGNPTTPPLVDESLATQGMRATLTRIYKTYTDTIRVLVTRDPYEFQSSAAAQILSSDRRWTHLVDEPAAEWHPATCRVPESTPFVLRDVADRLITRAVVILN